MAWSRAQTCSRLQGSGKKHSFPREPDHPPSRIDHANETCLYAEMSCHHRRMATQIVLQNDRLLLHRRLLPLTLFLYNACRDTSSTPLPAGKMNIPQLLRYATRATSASSRLCDISQPRSQAEKKTSNPCSSLIKTCMFATTTTTTTSSCWWVSRHPAAHTQAASTGLPKAKENAALFDEYQ